MAFQELWGTQQHATHHTCCTALDTGLSAFDDPSLGNGGQMGVVVASEPSHSHPLQRRVCNVHDCLAPGMVCMGWRYSARLFWSRKAGRGFEMLPRGLGFASGRFEPAESPIFLRLRSFKSQFRQPSKVQHMKVVDPSACRLLTKVFKHLPLDAPLFDSSPYQYRKRWDLVLRLLSVPVNFHLTPGGLRGGAAVYHYKCGKPINDLMWLLRLRSQSTLESYLQEVAALNIFARLPSNARECIRMASAFFQFLPSGDCCLAG